MSFLLVEPARDVRAALSAFWRNCQSPLAGKHAATRGHRQNTLKNPGICVSATTWQRCNTNFDEAVWQVVFLKKKQDSSFSEEKEAKRLLFPGAVPLYAPGDAIEVSW
jgi:hypothetical protein